MSWEKSSVFPSTEPGFLFWKMAAPWMVGYVTYLSCSERCHWEGSRTLKLQTWICTKLSSFVPSCQSPGSFEFHRDPKWSKETGETTWLQSLLATAGMLSVQAGRWNPGYHYCASHSTWALGLWTKMTAHTPGYSPGPFICAPPQGKVALSLSPSSLALSPCVSLSNLLLPFFLPLFAHHWATLKPDWDPRILILQHKLNCPQIPSAFSGVHGPGWAGPLVQLSSGSGDVMSQTCPQRNVLAYHLLQQGTSHT